jgi:hypothetical protein
MPYVMFPGHLISHHDTAWLSRPPDPTAPKFFILGHSKPEVYNNKPWTFMEKKEHIADETTATDATLLQSYGEFSIKISRMCHVSW